MAIKAIVAHRLDENNVGDISSNPLQYFLDRSEYDVVDVASLGTKGYDDTLPLIVGGGGLINNAFMGDFYRELLDSPDRIQLERMYEESWDLRNEKYLPEYKEFHERYQRLIKNTIEKIKPIDAPRIIWGAGINSDDDLEFHEIRWPKSFIRYQKIGIRDFHTSAKFEWVPCASCMHPALQKSYSIKNEIIFFEHKKQLIKSSEFGSDSIPRFINSGSNIEQTIELLGSANIILTNSYHGAYWGTLLKKKVILVGSWSSKFKWFKFRPRFLERKESWQDVVDEVVIYENALDECRQKNLNFWEDVKQYL